MLEISCRGSFVHAMRITHVVNNFYVAFGIRFLKCNDFILKLNMLHILKSFFNALLASKTKNRLSLDEVHFMSNN